VAQRHAPPATFKKQNQKHFFISMYPNHSLIYETGQNYPSSPSIKCPKASFVQQNPQRVNLTFGCVTETSPWSGELPFFASKCTFYKAPCPFETLDTCISLATDLRILVTIILRSQGWRTPE
jgi:hypothetical protein